MPKVIRHCWRLLPTVVSTLSKYLSRTERTLMRAPTTARPRWLLRKSADTTKSPSIYRNAVSAAARLLHAFEPDHHQQPGITASPFYLCAASCAICDRPASTDHIR